MGRAWNFRQPASLRSNPFQFHTEATCSSRGNQAIYLASYWRLDPARAVGAGAPGLVLAEPAQFIRELRPRQGILLAAWNSAELLGVVSALGIVRSVAADFSRAEVEWRAAEISLRPLPAGRRWWTQAKPYFRFARNVAERYMLDDLFAEHFPELAAIEFDRPSPARRSEARPSDYPTEGYVYVIRSRYGYKIGKTVNIRERTRLFAVKLPFPISMEYCARFDDYTAAERQFHRTFAGKRLEGEWFDLDEADLARIRTQGQAVALDGF
jgi:hypothetical protein